MARLFSNIVMALAALLMAVAAMTSPARAQICSTVCSMYIEGQCVEHEQTCTTQDPAENHYGAIAYGRKSGAFGYSFRLNSQAQAEQTALRNCAGHGNDCEIMVWFVRRCGAVAARADNTTAYWGLGNNDAQARAAAMTECTKDRGRQCVVKVSQCSL